MVQTHDEIKSKIAAAAAPNIAFDGYTQAVFNQAVTDCGFDTGFAALVCPNGATDLAIFAHIAADKEMTHRLMSVDLAEMRIRDRIAFAVKTRLEIAAVDKELVRRSAAHLAQPQHAAKSTALMWGTADAIWNVLGDTSEDVNFYTKRATLAAVYSATVLYWLGDESENFAATLAFLDRRIENVMQFEKLKSGLGKIPFAAKLVDAANAAVEKSRKGVRFQNMPGSVGKQK